MKQFKDHTTFFDLGIDTDIKNFSTLYCVMSETTKKRNNITKLALRYLFEDKSLTENEIKIAKSILDDSFYQKPNKYEHCKICSSDFQRIVLENYSSQFKYWEVCFPTVPYFPGNMMIYLKNRKNYRLEDLQDLTKEEFEELKFIIKNLKETLNQNLFCGDLTGINVLFNQISKSQLCIHGHIELMIKDIDTMNYGCKLLNIRNYDPIVSHVNSIFENNNHILKTLEGIRINMNDVSLDECLKNLKQYENELRKIIGLGHDLRNGIKEAENEEELQLLNGMSPAPTNSVYITDYRNNLYLSSVPEVIPPTINLSEVGDLENSENMYLIKYNATTPNPDYSIIKKYSPTVRPSSKVPYETEYSRNVKLLTKKIGEVLGVKL